MVASTAEGNLYNCYGFQFQNAVQDVASLTSPTPPYACPADWVDFVLVYYFANASFEQWWLRLFRAVEVTIPVPGVGDVRFYIFDTDIWADMLAMEGTFYGMGWWPCEYFTLPGVEGGDWPNFRFDPAFPDGESLLVWPP